MIDSPVVNANPMLSALLGGRAREILFEQRFALFLPQMTLFEVEKYLPFAVRKPPTQSWIAADSRVEFMRFEDVDDDPEPKDLAIRWFAAKDKAFAVPLPGHPEVSVCQEPSLVKLPEGRLFCVMRTSAGSPFWSTSGDLGETWTPPRRDGGEPLLHPLSSGPMYDLGGNLAGSGR